jgi:hypothetical protein
VVSDLISYAASLYQLPRRFKSLWENIKVENCYHCRQKYQRAIPLAGFRQTDHLMASTQFQLNVFNMCVETLSDIFRLAGYQIFTIFPDTTSNLKDFQTPLLSKSFAPIIDLPMLSHQARSLELTLDEWEAEPGDRLLHFERST